MTKVALVTGAAAGIGRACALRLAREGHAVGVLDLDRARCTGTLADIAAAGGQAVALAAARGRKFIMPHPKARSDARASK